MRRRYTVLASLALLAALGLGGVAVRFGPAFTLSMGLAAPSAGPWLATLLPAPSREAVTLTVRGRPVEADLYRPAKPRQALVLVHGLSRAGRRHPDLVHLARLLAAHRVLVLVPHLESLAAFRLDGSEVDAIAAAAAALSGRGHPVGVAGFSFGAGPALLAAAGRPGLRLVGSFGGYADLRNVIAFITTGVHTFHGRRYVLRQEEYNRWKLLSLLVGFVRTSDRAPLEQIVQRKLEDPSADTSALERDLGEAGRTLLRLVLNRSEEAVAALVAALPPSAREALDRLSPLSAVPGISARLLIAHGAGDASIPFTESLRLAEAAGERARLTIFRTFHHTGPATLWQSARTRALDGWDLFRLVDDLITWGASKGPPSPPHARGASAKPRRPSISPSGHGGARSPPCNQPSPERCAISTRAASRSRTISRRS